MLDFCSGIAVTGLGHAHPHLVAALTEQAGRLWHVSNLFQHPRARSAWPTGWSPHTFADTVFVCNSGAEAIEGAIKMVRRHFWAKGTPERHRIITFEGAFHGRTMAGISAAGGKKLVEGFDPLLPGFDIVPFGDQDAVRAAIGPETAAIMVEPIQGEGGIRPRPPHSCRGCARCATSTGCSWCFDEIQAGMGRTGTLLACEQAGVAPGHRRHRQGPGRRLPDRRLPRHRHAAASGMTAGTHGSTFGGNPLACAVANAVLDVMLATGFLARVAERGRLFRERLEAIAAEYPGGDRRGARARACSSACGCIATAPASSSALQDLGLVTVPAAEEVVRLLPPLTVSEDELDAGLRA